MTRVLAIVLTGVLAVALAGCGDDGGGATDTGSSSSSSAGRTSGSVDATTLAVIGQSGAGGTVDLHATVLDSGAAVTEFAQQFRTDAVQHRIESAIRRADVPSDRTVLGAVVSLGCDVPPGVTVQATGAGLMITPMEVASPRQECLVAVTTIALVSVPSDAV